MTWYWLYYFCPHQFGKQLGNTWILKSKKFDNWTPSKNHIKTELFKHSMNMNDCLFWKIRHFICNQTFNIYFRTLNVYFLFINIYFFHVPSYLSSNSLGTREEPAAIEPIEFRLFDWLFFIIPSDDSPVIFFLAYTNKERRITCQLSSKSTVFLLLTCISSQVQNRPYLRYGSA